jgi:hypothetical protein
VAVLTLLLVLDAVTQTVLIAALGASTFIIYANPQGSIEAIKHVSAGFRFFK